MRLSLFPVLALAAACGSSNGTIKVSITDAPTDLTNVSQVLITYDELRIHDEASDSEPADAGTADAAADGVDGKGWMVLCSETNQFDLLGLTGGVFAPVCTQKLADGGTGEAEISVPAGRISQLRLHVTSAKLVFNDGSPEVSLTVPSGPQSGLKINVDRDVPAGGTLEVKLDFNAASSITRTGSGAYVFKPVLSVLP